MKITFYILIAWFVILLPTIKIAFSEFITPDEKYTSYIETEENLLFMLEKENAVFPDQFYQVPSSWESDRINWSSDWHLYESYLEQSILELENLVIAEKPAGSKKGKKRKLSSDQYWGKVYQNVSDFNLERIENIARAFIWFQEENDLTDYEVLSILIDYIQQIPYEIPENLYGLYAPSEILYKNAGDCDSKSLFAAILLKRLGYDAVVYYSSEYSHAMLGVNIPSSGSYKEMNGRNYYFTEMTTEGWQIGELPADCSDLNYWYILSI